MRVLSIHNKYQMRGGEDESRQAEERLLKEMGHFVDIYEEDNDRITSMSPIKAGIRTIWSTEAHHIVHQKITRSTYDLVHVQNFFPLISPSIYYAAKAQNIPVIQTLRNYRLLCPNALFFRDGQICEDCLGKLIPYPGVVHGCYRNSRAASSVTAAMLTLHRAAGTWNKMVDYYIALTEFAKKKFIEGGLPAEKILVKPNFIHPDPNIGSGKGGYALFVGRLSVEKGLDTLLQAWTYLDGQIPLKIVGDGPLASKVAEAAKQLPDVEWLGQQPMDQVQQLMGEAMFLVFPSKWYETFGRVAIESFAKGTPVIASKIGAIAELIKHGQTGLYFQSGDAKDLATKIQDYISISPQQIAQMRQAARAEFESKYTAKENYKQLINIYKQALKPNSV